MKKPILIGVVVVIIAGIATILILPQKKPTASSSSPAPAQEENVAISENFEDAEIEGFDDLAPKEKAMALVKKAIEYYRKHGKEATMKIVGDRNGPFVKGEYYLGMRTLEGRTLAHGANINLVGKNIYMLTDTDGKYFVQNQINTVKTKGSGWVHYKWMNPVKKEIEPKTTYVEGVKGENFYFLCGVYSKDKT